MEVTFSLDKEEMYHMSDYFMLLLNSQHILVFSLVYNAQETSSLNRCLLFF